MGSAQQQTTVGLESLAGKLAVVTGGGSGMGRELVRQLAAVGCSVAACDVNQQTVEQTATLAGPGAPPAVAVTAHRCDVSDEAQVLRFRDELLAEHASNHVDLVFNNAGIGGGGSFVNDSREEWERTFAVDWCGVYYCARAFLPLLIASGDGVLVNTSSLNGLWATLGPGMPNNAYSTAKFAIRGFTEALIEDLRTNAPQVRVALVLPGLVGTDIIANTRRAHGMPGPEDMSADQVEQAKEFLVTAKLVNADAPPEEVRQTLIRLETEGKDKALLSAADAATIILDGVRSGAWRILVGKDAAFVDERVRSIPESAYDYAEVFKDLPGDLLQGASNLPEGVRDLLPDWVKDQLPDAGAGERPGQRDAGS
jgi:NAD(P)-dependent dehydrogenase (short-subunit alcohol dehydrogenase family)